MDTATDRDWRECVYGAEWRAWRDPEYPERFNPATYLLDRHLGTATESKTALIVDNEELSYGALHEITSRAARGLAALGLGPEDRVLFFGTDSIEYVAFWLGAVRAGIVPAVVSDQYKAPMLRYFLDDTAAKALIIDAEQAPKFAEIVGDIPTAIRAVIVRGSASGITPGFGRKLTTCQELLAAQAGHFAPIARHHNDVAYMFYSGGTTGTAKGIVHLAHDFPLIPARQGAFWEYDANDVVHATSKKYFTHGLWPGVLIPLYHGAVSVISRLAPTPENVVQMVERHRVTKLITVPTIVKNLMLHAERAERRPDFSSVQLAITASEKMPPEIFAKFRDTFGTELMDSIGSSEITYEWIANRPKEFRPGSLGKPVFGYEVRLVDADGNQVTVPDQDGEAWIKSKTAAFYYWRKFDRTKETFIGPWTRTGDTLRFDADGFFWFSGRADDVFKVKGLWVSPIEVEAAITEHPAVLEAAVVAFDDSDGLTKPKAFVVLRPDHAASARLDTELKEAVRRIGGYKVPEEIEYRDELPRTTLLKIDRRALREAERERRRH